MSKLFATIVVATMLLCTMAVIMPAKAAAPTPPAMWIVPETETFYTSTTPVGTLFDVTIWVATTASDSYSWQAALYFNSTQLEAVSCEFTNGTVSQWIKDNSATNPGGAFGAPPDIENALGYVLAGETLLGDIALNYIPASTGSLVTITFNVTVAPGSGETLSSIMEFSPPGSLQSSFVDDVNGLDEPGLTFGTFTYSLIYASATPPTIEDPTQVPPIDIVDASQSVVVSTNVTDNSGTGLKNVTLSYSTDNVIFTSTAMALNVTKGLWDGTIPGYASGTTVYYNILAYDNAGNHAINSNTGNWNYQVIPEFTSILIIVMLFAMASAVLLMRKKIVS